MDHLAQCQILNNSWTNVADDDDDNGYNILIFFIYSRHFFNSYYVPNTVLEQTLVKSSPPSAFMNKILLDIVMPIHSQMVYGCFCTRMAELMFTSQPLTENIF